MGYNVFCGEKQNNTIWAEIANEFSPLLFI